MRPVFRVTVLLLPLLCSTARAGTFSFDAPDAGPSAAEPFARGSWSFELFTAYSAPIRYSEEDVYSAGAALGYYLFDDFALLGRVSAVGVDQPVSDDAVGGSVELFIRWHLLTVERFTLFLDGGGGRMWTDTPTPRGGTPSNWTGRVGLGATLRLSDDLHLIGGARYLHYSNGDVHGRERNPGYDGVEGYVGLMWRF